MTDSRNEFYIQWHFLERCNLRCVHCYQEGYLFNDLEFEKLTQIADVIIKTLQKWKKQGRISLTGGEPFLSQHLIDIVEYLQKAEEIKYIDILTNGTCITREIIPQIKHLNKIRQIQVSLDGASHTTHDKIRGKGSFDKALKGIRLLKEDGIQVAMMFTLFRENKDEIPQLIELAIKERIDALTVERVTPCGEGQNLKNQILSPNELKDIYEYLSRVAETDEVKQSGLVIRRARPLWVNTISGDFNSAIEKKIGGFCPIGYTAMAILADGTVLPCRRLNIPIGNIMKDGLFKIWYTSEVLWNIRNKGKLQGNCNKCELIPYCGGCRAIAYELSGDYMGEDSQCWKQLKMNQY